MTGLALVLIAIGFAIAGFGLMLQGEPKQVIRGSLPVRRLFPAVGRRGADVSRRLQKREQAEEQAAARG